MWAPEELTSPGRDRWPWVPNISFKEIFFYKNQVFKKIHQQFTIPKLKTKLKFSQFTSQITPFII